MDTPYAEPTTHPDLTADSAARVAAHLERRGVRFGRDATPFVVDPVPRVIDAAQWHVLEAGLAQRARALDAFVADAHGPRRAVAEGVVPARVVETAALLDPAAAPLGPAPGSGRRWIGIAGLDLVRDADGTFCVLEDNCRTPSGLAYAVAAREALTAVLGERELDAVRPLDAIPAMLAAVVDAARPGGAVGTGTERTVVLTDGPRNTAYYEHRMLAVALGVPLVTPSDLHVERDRLWMVGGMEPLEVVYRRTDADVTDSPIGRLLGPALAAGTLGLVNAFGTGVADDKLTHAYVEDLIRFFCGEEPLLPSVRTLDLGTDAGLAEALDRLPGLVVKPRDGFGGHGVVIAERLETTGLDALRAQLLAAPEDFVAQELVPLSTHPTMVDGVPCPRHVDLRPFVLLAGEDAHVVPGGLTRVALEEGSLVVNSSRNGGAKDTWVLR